MLFCSWIYSTLPENKQILALSATYPEVLAQHLTAYMRNPTFVRMNASDPALLGMLRLKTCKTNRDHTENFHIVAYKCFTGIRQYYKTVAFHPLPQKSLENKVNTLVELLSHINFSQCLIFSNYQMRLVYSLQVSLLLLFPIFVMGFRLVLKVYFAITERYIVLNHFLHRSNYRSYEYTSWPDELFVVYISLVRK